MTTRCSTARSLVSARLYDRCAALSPAQQEPVLPAMKSLSLAFALTSVIALAACTPMGNLTPEPQAAESLYLTPEELGRMASAPTRVYPGDTLRIVRDAQESTLDIRNLVEDSQSQLYVVRPDGSISYRYVGRIEAAGKTPDELAQAMRDKLASVYREPGVTINIVTSPSSKVVIGGAVRAPATFDMSAVATVEQGLFAAGGMMPSADSRHVALLRLDAQQHYQLHFIDFAHLLQPGNSVPTLAFARGDILFVPKSAAGNMGDGVEVYINQLLPFTRALGVSYNYGSTQVKQ